MKKGLLFIVLAGVMWGSSCIFVNILAPCGISSAQMTAARLSVSFIGMLLYCLIFDRTAFKVKSRDMLVFALCGFSIFGTAFFYYESMQLTTASTAVVLMYISPVPIMLLSVLFLGERFTVKKAIAVALMLFGCAFVAGVVGNFKPDTLGIVFGLLSAVTYTAYNIFSKIAARRKAGSISATLYTFMFGSIAALAFSKPWEMPELISNKPEFLIPVMIIHGLVTCLLPYFAYTISLKSLSVGVASALSIIEPLTGSLFGFILYSEPIDAFKVIGIALVISSVFLLGISEKDKNKKV